MDIISAIPDEYKKALLPKLKARPIRTASGVRRRPCFFLSAPVLTDERLGWCGTDRSSGGHV